MADGQLTGDYFSGVSMKLAGPETVRSVTREWAGDRDTKGRTQFG